MIAESIIFLYHRLSLIGIKGRIQVRSYEENEDTKYITEIIVDKVSLLTSKKPEE